MQVCVSLGSRERKKIFKIHRAVAETFIPNPENKQQVNHKDGNKQNNTVLNLEWATPKENMEHASKTGLLHPLSGVDSNSAKFTKEDILYIRENYIAYDNEYGTRALGKKFNVNHETIRNIIHYNTYTNI